MNQLEIIMKRKGLSEEEKKRGRKAANAWHAGRPARPLNPAAPWNPLFRDWVRLVSNKKLGIR
jgi:hypothetical protein